MAETQQKLEQLTYAELRDEILNAEPQLASLIDNLSENELKIKYRTLIQPSLKENQKVDPINAQNTQSVHPEHDCSIQVQPLRQNLPRPDLIRDSLIHNVPEMKQCVRQFSDEQLYEIYTDFYQRNKGFPLSNDPKMAAMINEVLDAYPYLEDRITSYNEEQVIKIHTALQAQKMRKGRTQHNPISVDALSQQGGQSTRAQVMRKETKEKIASEGGQADKLAEQVEMMEQDENGCSNLSNPNECQPLQSIIQENLSEAEGVECLARDGAGRAEVWSMDHPHNASNIHARTYLMIHTQYEGAGMPRKLLKSDPPSHPCECNCCKNNTIQSMCAQLITAINSNKK